MATIQDYGDIKTAWCPGCGNFSIREAVKKALVGLGLAPHQVQFVSGIGQAAKAPHYINVNLFDGLHGRSLPAATGIHAANPNLPLFIESGDGCSYGEGGNHFLAGVRRNPNVTYLVHDNQVYGLTKGQSSPTSSAGFVTKAQPFGSLNEPLNPVLLAVSMKAGFVARGFSGDVDQLADLIMQAHRYRGFALVDILQPCVTFNPVNTFAWYKKRCRPLPPDHDPTDWRAAMVMADKWGDEIPVGVIYRNDGLTAYEDRHPALKKGPLVGQKVDWDALAEIMDRFA